MVDRTRLNMAVGIVLVAMSGGCGQSASRAYEAAIHAEAQGDKAGAIEFYIAAARAGLSAAKFQLGLKYANGDGVAQNDAEALNWYLQAASDNHDIATNNIGALINNSRGLAREPSRALAWYLRAAALGNGTAMANIASYYRNGTFVNRNINKEHFWLALAERYGHGPSGANRRRLDGSISDDAKRKIDQAVHNYRYEDFLGVTSDLRAAADTRDFLVRGETSWDPISSPIQFQYPTIAG